MEIDSYLEQCNLHVKELFFLFSFFIIKKKIFINAHTKKNAKKKRKTCKDKINFKKENINCIHTAVIFNDIDLPGCWGMWDFGTPWMSSLNETDFSNDTDLSVNY